MRLIIKRSTVAAAAIALLATTNSLAQAPLPDSFASITALPDRTMSLTLTGRVASTLRPYFDIYPLEVSSDLVTWRLLTTLVRTNASTNALIHVDTEAGAYSARLYRTFTNQLVTPLPKPSGPYPVGRVSRLLTDPSRTNRYAELTILSAPSPSPAPGALSPRRPRAARSTAQARLELRSNR